ncbi:phage tail assembly chaperone [Phyllobacterium zundukense]|nr:phage tail assembly chaperone [Phyllobacterium zundukense]
MLAHDDRRIELRPSLRAAYILEQKHGYDKLARGVFDCNLGIVYDIAALGSTDEIAVREFLNDMIERDGAQVIENLAPALYEFLILSFGLNHEPKPMKSKSTVTTSGPELSLEERFNQLFAHATGWLHWTPETVWNSTPAEIMLARDAHIELLHNIHSGSDTADKPSAPYDPLEEISPEEVSAGIAKLRAKHGSVARVK